VSGCSGIRSKEDITETQPSRGTLKEKNQLKELYQRLRHLSLLDNLAHKCDWIRICGQNQITLSLPMHRSAVLTQNITALAEEKFQP